MEIPGKYRNILNPHQTPREIKNSIRVLDGLWKKLLKDGKSDEEIQVIYRVNEPDRSWDKPL